MSSKTISCPTCGGPVAPNTTSPSIACGYCNHHFTNPLYEKPAATPVVVVSDGSTKSAGIFYALAVFGTPLIVGGIAFAIYYFAAARSAEYVEKIQQSLESQTVNIPKSPELPDSPDSPAVPERQPTPVPVKVSVADQKEQKLDGYLDCSQEAMASFRRTMERYLSWIKDPKKGPTCTERYIDWGMYSVPDHILNSCRKMLASNEIPPPIAPLHDAAAAQLQAVERALPLFNEAQRYYEQKRYTLDNCQKGKALHPQLMKSYEELSRTHLQLYALLIDHTQGRLARCLAKTAKEASLAAANRWTAHLIFSQALMTTFNEESRKKKVNVELLKNIAEKLVTRTEALVSMSAEQHEAAGFDSGAKSAVDKFVESVLAFVQSEGGKKLSSSASFFVRNGHDRKQYEGTREHLVAAFENLIENYNRSIKPCGRIFPCSEEGECPAR